MNRRLSWAKYDKFNARYFCRELMLDHHMTYIIDTAAEKVLYLKYEEGYIILPEIFTPVDGAYCHAAGQYRSRQF